MNAHPLPIVDKLEIRWMTKPNPGPADLHLPLSLYPTAAQEHVTEGMLADMFRLDVREVRAMNAFTHDLLISRAIEAGYISLTWSPRSHSFPSVLEELSRAILGHWSRLLTTTEREERRHVLFVIRALRRQYYAQDETHTQKA